MRTIVTRRVGIACAAAAIATATAAAPVAAQAGRTVVRPGESIQQALDASPDGATVVVGPGVYAESLTITRPVHLVGLHGAVLVPPAAPPDNLCTRDPDAPGGLAPGICVAGSVTDPDSEHPAVTDPVDDVTISGLSVQDFQFPGVEIYGAHRLRMDSLTLTGLESGVYVSQSDDVQLTHLSVHDTGGRGLDLHDGYRDVVVRDSTFSDNQGEGIFVGSGTGAELSGNTITGNCVGIAAVDLGLPGLDGLSRLTVRGNRVDHNNKFCASDDEGAPSQSGTGIALVGAVDSVVADNVVTGHTGSPDPASGAPAAFSLGGIALLDASRITGGAVPHDNLFLGNVATGNLPFDVLTDGTGTGNRFQATTCGTATLPGICTGHRDGAGR